MKAQFLPEALDPTVDDVLAGRAPVTVGVIDQRLSRTNYFDGRLLTADDLTRDQIYFDQRLLEAGLAIGFGIAGERDFALTLLGNGAQLAIDPGHGIGADGRALSLHERVTVDLGNFAALQKINGGAKVLFRDGIYAVCIHGSERLDGLAEAFPLDLGTRRQPQPSTIAETVEVFLVRLPLPYGGDELALRAHLSTVLYRAPNPQAWLPADALPLGLIEMQHESARWVDAGLLRPVRRAPGILGAAQRDLAARYESIFTALDARYPTGFVAAEHFELLPPCGTVPKGMVDPVNGAQSYFPERFDVAIAPVRKDDVEALRREAFGNPPLDMRDMSLDASVLIGVALDAATFGRLVPLFTAPVAQRLALAAQPATLAAAATPAALLDARLDALRMTQVAAFRAPYLRLLDGDLLRNIFIQRPAHVLDTDAAIWADLWPKITSRDLFFVRRAPRAAEVGIGGVVLARGYVPPPPASPVPPKDTIPDPAPPPPPSTPSVVITPPAITRPGLLDPFRPVDVGTLRTDVAVTKIPAATDATTVPTPATTTVPAGGTLPTKLTGSLTPAGSLVGSVTPRTLSAPATKSAKTTTPKSKPTRKTPR